MDKKEELLYKSCEIETDKSAEILADVQIGLIVYFYELGNNNLKETGYEEIILAEHLWDMKAGEIIWTNEEYEAVNAGEEVTLNVFVKKDDTKTKYSLSVITPETKGQNWKLGVMCENESAISITVGIDTAYSKTKVIELSE